MSYVDVDTNNWNKSQVRIKFHFIYSDCVSGHDIGIIKSDRFE